jgi:hypothetical protein
LEIAFARDHGAAGMGININHITGTDRNFDVVNGYSLDLVNHYDLSK